MTLVFAIAVFLLVPLLGALALGPQAGDLRWRRWHHGYGGFLLVALSAGAARVGGPWWWLAILCVAALAGLVLEADDAYQHMEQRFGDAPDYRSPAHRLYGRALERWPRLARVEAWLNSLFA